MIEPIYILDTNIISAYLRDMAGDLSQKIHQHRQFNLILPEPVIYEVKRGFKHPIATRKLAIFETRIILMFNREAVTADDWEVASDLWAYTRSIGRQLSDMDLLIGAITKRLNGTLVTDDQDFNVLPIPVVNWL